MYQDPQWPSECGLSLVHSVYRFRDNTRIADKSKNLAQAEAFYSSCQVTSVCAQCFLKCCKPRVGGLRAFMGSIHIVESALVPMASL